MPDHRFTPGPWREYDRNDMGDIYLCGEGGSATAIVLQSSIPPVAGRTEANAHLIEAAPDLLAVAMGALAMTELLALAPPVAWGIDSRTFALDFSKIKLDLHAAIDKALGGVS